LQLDAVTYRYRSEDGSGFVVGPLDLTLQRGERVFLVGGNGSGKSTLARLITGLYRPDTGCLRVDGRAVGEHDLAAYQQLFSTVFSDFHLFRQLLGVAGEDAPRDVVQAWLALLRMAHKVRIEQARLLDLELSQGQRKRLGLLLAVLEGRGVLLLDEWAADQDPAYRRAFYQQLLPQLSEQGVTVIAITHDDHYFHLADRLLKMEGGQLYALPVPAPGEAQRGRALP
jgi:putative ATP-binding cassette transporter